MKIRDHRNPGWFWAQNELFDVFAPLIGANGVTVYMAMSRLLSKAGSVGRLSLREIAKCAGVSKDTVDRACADMLALGMIERTVNGANVSSTFALLDLTAAAQPGLEELESRLTHSANNQRPTRDLPSTKPTVSKTVSGMKAETVESVSIRDSLGANPQYLRGSPQNETVSIRDSLGVGPPVSETVFATVVSLPGDSCASQSKLFNTNTNTERESARAQGGASEPAAERVLDLPALAGMIVVAHPRARMLGWTELDVPASDREAVSEAARAEARLVACTPEDAAVRMLGQVQQIAREVPREKWRFVSPIEKFFRRREYRAKPRDLYSGDDPSPARQQRPDATVGMAATQTNSEAAGRSAALSYWRRMRDKGAAIYEHDAPRWVKDALRAEISTAQQSPAA